MEKSRSCKWALSGVRLRISLQSRLVTSARPQQLRVLEEGRGQGAYPPDMAFGCMSFVLLTYVTWTSLSLFSLNLLY